MSLHDHAADLADIEAIKQVKYRYLRALDTKNWDDYADTLAEDIKADYGPSMAKSCTSPTAPTWWITCVPRSARTSSPNTG